MTVGDASDVFLQDIDAGSYESAKKNATLISASKTTAEPKKRARTTLDTFFMAPTDKSGQAASKKLKLTASSSSLTSGSSSSELVSLPKLNSIPFSLSAFQASLSEESRNLLQLECETMGMSWLKMLKDEMQKSYFLNLKKLLWNEGVRGKDTPSSVKVYPPAQNVYAWSKTPLGKVKVVIVGQDPYHGPGQAHGLCFSVPPGITVPPSLRNIYEELKAEFPDFVPPKHGHLANWANNGVLMLNTCLTVKAGQAGSHSKKGWEQFTEKVIEVVDKYGGANLPNGAGSEASGIGRGIVFLAWGAWAAERVAKLNKKKHLILTSAHPSPFSAHKGFLGNGHFAKANSWLEGKYGPEGGVNWCDLDVHGATG